MQIENTLQERASHEAAPALDLSATFQDKNLLVIGGTGFLGKVWFSLFLNRFPEIKHIYLLVRAKKTQTTTQRFWKEIIPSPAIDPIRELYPDEESFHKFIESKVTPIPGDVSHANVGIPNDMLDILKNNVDAIVNVAGVVDFMPPIDNALKVNCFGIKNLIQLCRTLGDVPIMHTSTCFVVGNRDGNILEEDPRTRPFPYCDKIDPMHWNPEREIEEGLRLVERAEHEAEEAFRQSEFYTQAKDELQRRGEPCRGPSLEKEFKKVRRKYVEKVLVKEGLTRAEYWGWTNTYTYTKSIGEQLLLGSNLPATIVRPAIVESTVHYPFPGWNEGITTSSPLIYALLHKGAFQMPGSWDCVLDMIPADLVCSGMIAALGALLQGTQKPVYQLGVSDTNPASTGRFQEIIGLHKRRHYRKKSGGNIFYNKLQQLYGSVPTNKEQFYRYGEPKQAELAGTLAKWTGQASKLPGLGFLKETSKTLSGVSRQLEKTTQIFDQFIPFMLERRYIFDCTNTHEVIGRVVEEDRKKLYWAPEEIDWRHWMTEIHIPGLNKWVIPLIEEKMRKKLKPRRAHVHLIDVLEESVENNPYGTCVQWLKGSQLYHMSYREFLRGVHFIAYRLQQAGVGLQDRVLLSGNNSPYWPMAYFGILYAGATAVPLDPELDQDRLHNLAKASKARYALWDQAFHEHAGHTLTDKAENGTPSIGFQLFESFEEIEEDFIVPTHPDIEPKDIASLIFTSGTTGEPKAVMLSHGNFTSILASLIPLFPLTHDDSALSLLPLHHTFEFTCGLLLPISRGTRITYIDELQGEQIVRALKEARITALVGVPALWQLLAKRIRSQLKERGDVVAGVFEALFKVNRSIGQNLGLDLGKALFAPIHHQLGGRLKYLISGGAALPKDTQDLFVSLGLPLTEGYGLTEAAPVLTVSKPSKKSKFGQVGQAIPGVKLKIESPNPEGIGEVLAKGPNVMVGYANNKEATEQVITEDGWLRTGDLGKLDHRGRLTLVGRAKETILTSNGENVYPDDLEELIGLPKYVEELVVLGIPSPKGGEEVAVMAVPSEHKKLTDEQRLARARESLLDRFAELPAHSRPTVLHLQLEELPRTATRKVKRRDVKKIVEALEAERAKTHQDTSHMSARIVNVIVDVTGASAKEVIHSTRLASDLGIDSLTMGELHVALEKEIGRNLPIRRLSRCDSVNAIQELLEQLHIELSDSDYIKEDEEEEFETVELPDFLQQAGKGLVGRLQAAFYKGVMNVRVYGRANIPHNRNTLVIANHASHLDTGLVITALGSYAKDIVTLGAKDYFFEGDDWRTFFFENFTNVLAIERAGTLEEGLLPAREALHQGKTLLIFPEGTRSKSGQITDFKPGVGVLARDYEIDILPIYLKGTYQSMPKGRPVPTKRKLEVHIGRPLSAAMIREKIADCDEKEAARRIALITQRAVEHLRDKEYFDFAAYQPETNIEKPKSVREEIQDILEYLNERYASDRVEEPVSFYFSLGQESDTKWSLIVDKEQCRFHQGKPTNGVADCVLKTSPEIFRQICTESYVPSPEEFISGAIKSNNIPMLQQFARIFDLV